MASNFPIISPMTKRLGASSQVAFGVDKQGRPIHLQKSGLASHRFAQMYSFAGQNVPWKMKIHHDPPSFLDVFGLLSHSHLAEI